MSEIIIDDVDVSGCEFKSCFDDECYSDVDSSENLNCKDNPNCYYKQLKRLQAENERLKEENSKIVWDEVCTTNCSKYKAYNKYRKALEEIRGILCKGRTFYDGYFENENLSRTDKAIKVISEVLK